MFFSWSLFFAWLYPKSEKQAWSSPTPLKHVTRYAPSHDPIESVAVLPQTVVIPAEIPSLETCLGVVGLNAKHLVAETRARIPETWACVDHAAASA